MEKIAYKTCPKCKIGQLDKRIPRDPIIKTLFFWADLKRYRCNNCYAKIYARTNRIEPQDLTPKPM